MGDGKTTIQEVILYKVFSIAAQGSAIGDRGALRCVSANRLPCRLPYVKRGIQK